ncbi:MAG: O-antigen ligase family protein [Candidatus Hydrogenedentes bacterium]|nr:O-antigen ligase family protein [Candidatus Hydrogenedentota bacterium]
MTDIQDRGVTELSEQSLINRIRIAIVCATVFLSALVYSTQIASFLHAKLFVLACGLTLLAAVSIFAPRSPKMRISAIALLGCFFVVAVNMAHFFTEPHPLRVKENRYSEYVFMLQFVLPLFLGLGFQLFRREDNRRWIIIAIVVTATSAAALAIAQYAGLITFLFPKFPGASRVYSVFGNSGLLGGYLAVAIPLALAKYLNEKATASILVVAMAIMACALLLSGARTAWFACAVGCAICVWRSADLRKIGLLCGVLAGVTAACVLLAPANTVSRAASLFSGSDAGANLRMWFWAGTWQMIREHLLTGVNIGRFPIESPAYFGKVLWAPGGERFMHNTLLTEHPHNDFLLIWAEAGIFGIALIAWLFCRLSRCRGPEWGGLAAWFLFACFNSPLHSPPHLLVGCLLVVCLVLRSTPNESPESKAHLWSRRAIAAIALMLAPLLWFSLVLPSYKLQQAQRAHVEGRPSLALYSDAAAYAGMLASEIDEKCGIALLDVKDYKSARDRFRSALRGSDSGSVWLGLGTAEYQLGNKSDAYAALEKAVYRWPSHLNAWRLLMRTCPASERVAWLDKAKRFLRSSEIKTLEREAVGEASPI